MNTITDTEFSRFQRFIYDAAGITLSPAKKALVCGRLSKRLQAHHLESFGAYFELLTSGHADGEVQTAVDLLTTNETYFFREPKHFELLRTLATQARGRPQPFRVWSAASSSGEECYSIAMVLADCLDASQTPWDIVGSDISTRVLQRARTGHYPMERARNIPPAYLKRYCLRGHGEQDGTLLVERRLRNRVNFAQVNLNTELPRLGTFDVVFLRNVMIYFNGDTKRQVVARVVSLVKPGGHLFIGHSESLNDISTAVEQLAPSIYRKPLTAMASGVLNEVFLKPGEFAVGDTSCRIRTVLGSCISIALWCPALQVGAMSHCLLPTRGRVGVRDARGLELRELDARYADEALHLMLHGLERRQVRAAACNAKIFGGGNMFPGQRGAGVPVGRRNGEAARRLLKAHGIEVVSESLFGDGHRQIVFDIASGDVWARQLPPADAIVGTAS